MLAPGYIPLKFHLNEAFKTKLRNKPVKWGFGGLSEFTFYRTYSRPKEDGSLETWADCVLRVIEGMFTILKTNAQYSHIPWEVDKAEKLAEEAAERMFDFKWTPPGRGLWVMGTDMVWDKGGAALNNPLHEDTKILTEEYGWIALKEIEGQNVRVLSKLRSKQKFTGGAGFVDAYISTKEMQPSYKITIETLLGNIKEIIASENHRWFVITDKKNSFENRITTDYLTNKHYLPRATPTKQYEPSFAGYCHGFFFGDGTRSNGELHQFTEDNKKILNSIFPEISFRENIYKLPSGLEAKIVKNLPKAWSKVPEGDYATDKKYVFGFLAGYFAADGSVGTTYRIASSKIEELEKVQELFEYVGIETKIIKDSSNSTNFSEDRDLYQLNICKHDLNEKFFLKESHLHHWVENKSKIKRPLHKVISIEKLEELQPVLCAVVPEHENFVIDGFTVTSNCAFVTTKNIGTEWSKPFGFLMDMSMLGVGVGFDTKGAGNIDIYKPEGDPEVITVEDSREGWVDLICTLIDSYMDPDGVPIIPDTHLVREYGTPIKGFGGVASGPEPLVQGFYGIMDILNKRANSDDNYITSTDIVDIMNIIGKIVVAGNVRRCLPEDTLIHTKTGLKEIKNIIPGEEVYTSKGVSKVSELVYQGEQEVISINTQLGSFKCTPKHKIAVLDSTNTYYWTQAQYLKTGDRLVFPEHEIEGIKTSLPSWEYNKTEKSTTCKDITIPELNKDVSWLLGLFHGDGYTYPNFEKNGYNAYISIACDNVNYPSITVKAKETLASFGPNLHFCDIPDSEKDKSYKIRIQSKQLSWYFSKFKEAHKCISVPDFILQGTKEIRASYLAGLFDADGSSIDRTTIAVYTVYEKYAKQIQALYASLGIPTRIKENWQKIYLVSIIGQDTIEKFEKLIAIHSEKYHNYNKTNRSQNDFGYPSAWIDKEVVNYGKSWTPQQEQMTYHKFKSLKGDSNLIPIKVESIEYNNEVVNTYDISVPGANEFIAGEGLLVHNTAEIAFSEPDDENFMTMKDYTKFPVEVGAKAPLELKEVDPEAYEKYNSFISRKIIEEKYQEEPWAYKFGGWRWASNNSLLGVVGMNYDKAAASIAVNGEPGFAWLDNMRKYGRMKDGINNKDHRVMGGNPCLEQSLESYELCCLVENFPNAHKDYWDFQRTLKFSYLYAKTVTLMGTHWSETNRVIARNRRIGCSQSGIQEAIGRFGRRKYFDEFCDRAYNYIQYVDKKYSEWLGIPLSIKTTSVKPSGTVSLVAGALPGIHYAESESYYRTVRVSAISPLVEILRKSNYRIEPSVTDSKKTVVIYFPVLHDVGTVTKSSVSIWEQFKNAADMQYWYADNQVSITITFKKEEASEISRCLSTFDNELKGVSLLPLADHNYEQAPYTSAPREEIEAYQKQLLPLDFSILTTTQVEEASGENLEANKFCEGDSCQLF